MILDSIAANYRAERSSANTPSALATRSVQLMRLGTLLQTLSRDHNCAMVIANQVTDRFLPLSLSRASASVPTGTILSSSPASTASSPQNATSLLSLDHQQRFFTGWGAEPSISCHNIKTPCLGLVWANLINCRIALVKEKGWESGNAEWNPRSWTRWMRVVFAPWIQGTEEREKGVEFEVWNGGIRAVNRATEPLIAP